MHGGSRHADQNSCFATANGSRLFVGRRRRCLWEIKLLCCLQVDCNGKVVKQITSRIRKLAHVPIQTWEGRDVDLFSWLPVGLWVKCIFFTARMWEVSQQRSHHGPLACCVSSAHHQLSRGCGSQVWEVEVTQCQLLQTHWEALQSHICVVMWQGHGPGGATMNESGTASVGRKCHLGHHKLRECLSPHPKEGP